jgi:putative CocE/NonD family hydrolase
MSVQTKYLSLALAWMLSIAAAAQSIAQSTPQFDVYVAHDIMVPMRDGVKLATDVYLPAINGQPLPGPWPAVVERTPYGKSSFLPNTPTGTDYAQHGFALVVQDVRGRYQSEGVFLSYSQEGPDGFDTMQWIYNQPWCNKKIGVTGSSYFASAAQAILVQNAPGLAAGIIRVGPGNYHEDGAWHGGAFLLAHNVNYALLLALAGTEAVHDPAVQSAIAAASQPPAAFDLMKQSPLARGAAPFGLAPSYDAWYQNWQDHELFDGYWKTIGNSFTDYYSQSPDVPILLLSEWYDAFLGGTLDGYAGYRRAHHAPVHMIIGGGEHLNIYAAAQTYAGDVDFGSGLPIDVPHELFRFWDRYLKGVHDGGAENDVVRTFRIESLAGQKNAAGRLQAGGSWQEFASWPPPDARPKTLYLTEDLHLTTEKPRAGSLSFRYDPSDPVPTVGGNVSSGGEVVQPGPYDQRCSPKHLACGNDTRPLNARPDVLSFTTAPLETDVDVTGMISVYLWVSSTAVDTDFTAKLIDQYPPTTDYPDGYAMILTDSVVRARLRSFTRAGDESRRIYAIRNEPLTPGRIYPVVVDLVGTSNLFRPGHRIRVDISSSNFPLRDANPNTGEPFADRNSPPMTARNTIYIGADHPSDIVLPIRHAERNSE